MNFETAQFTEMICSKKQSLTFTSAEKAFKKYDTEFGKNKYRVLGITQGNACSTPSCLF